MSEFVIWKHGGGRVHRGARVSQGAIVGQDSIVEQGAIVGQGAIVQGGALVGQGARVGPRARVLKGARVEQDAIVELRAIVGPRAVVGKHVRVAALSVIHPYQRITQDTLALVGTIYPVTLSEHGIKIGCEPPRWPEKWLAKNWKTIDGDRSEWFENMEALAALWHSFFEYEECGEGES